MFFIRHVLSLVFAATGILAASYSTVYKDLKAVDADMNALTSSCKNYTGTGVQMLMIRFQSNAYTRDVNQTVYDVNSSPIRTTAESQNLTKFLNNPYGPDLKLLATCLVERKNTTPFKGLDSTVQNGMRNIMDAFIKSGRSTTEKSDLQTLKNKFDSYFPRRPIETLFPKAI